MAIVLGALATLGGCGAGAAATSSGAAAASTTATARAGGLVVTLAVTPARVGAAVQVELTARTPHASGALGYLLRYGDGTTGGSGAVPQFCLAGAAPPAHRRLGRRAPLCRARSLRGVGHRVRQLHARARHRHGLGARAVAQRP